MSELKNTKYSLFEGRIHEDNNENIFLIMVIWVCVYGSNIGTDMANFCNISLYIDF